MSSPLLREPTVRTLVDKFNALPRRPLNPSGHGANRWVFMLQHVPFSPAGDILILVNPPTRYIHAEGPMPSPLTGTGSEKHPPLTRERADDVAVLLLKAFVGGLGAVDASTPTGAPWEWAMEKAEDGKILGEALNRLGVRSELCNVGVYNEEEAEVLYESAMEVFKTTFAAILEDIDTELSMQG